MSIKRFFKFILIELAIMVLLLNVGYAKVSNASDNSEVAFSNGIFDVQFENASIVKSAGVNTEKTFIKLSNNGQNLTTNVADLAYPGAGAEFSVNIVNNGSVPVKISSIVVEGIDDTSFLKVSILNENSLNNKILYSGEKCNMYFTVVWDKSYTYSLNEVANFSLKVNCIQAI